MTNIEWTDATWNPVVGCTRVSAGCDHCYTVGMTRRLEGMAKGGPGRSGRKQHYAGLTVLNAKGDRHFNGTVRCVPEALGIPLHWKTPRRIFVNSMSDLFHRDVPFEFIDKVFAVMALCPQHTFQVLTKRPERMAKYLAHVDGVDDYGRPYSTERRVNEQAKAIEYDRCREAAWFSWPLPNVWLGTSCEDQAAADERIPHLLRCPAAVRFLSCEPLLGPIDIRPFLQALPGVLMCSHCGYRTNIAERYCPNSENDDIELRPDVGMDWVIVGGESGPKARPCNVDWIRSIVQQCQEAAVPCFVKQLGSYPVCNDVDREKHDRGTLFVEDGVYRNRWIMKLIDRKGGDPSEWPEDLRVREFPTPNGAVAC